MMNERNRWDNYFLTYYFLYSTSLYQGQQEQFFKNGFEK